MKNKKIVFAGFFFASAIFVLAGCGLLSQTSGGGESYFPHADGYSWRYAYTDGSSSIMTVEGTRLIVLTTVQIVKSTSTTASGSNSTSESYWKADATAVYLFPSVITTESFTMLSFPLEVGKSWTAYNAHGYTMEASVLVSENVTVAAGTFSCYKVKYTTKIGTSETTSNYWYGNNAGVVKATSSSSTVESTLTSKNF